VVEEVIYVEKYHSHEIVLEKSLNHTNIKIPMVGGTETHKLLFVFVGNVAHNGPNDVTVVGMDSTR
jgi:hypothetical protein